MTSWLRSIRTHKRTSARPTRYFWLLVAMMFALFLQAYMHNFNIVYITLFFIFALGVVAEFTGRMNLSALSVRPLGRERAFAGHEHRYGVALANPSQRVCYALVLDNGGGTQQVSRLGAGAEAIVTMTHRPERRGTMRLPGLEVSSFFPLPHLRFSKRFDPETEVTVFPRPLGEPLAAFLAVNPSLQGERSDFEGIRRYEPGDTLAMVHWPSVAKNATMMSKQFVHEQRSEQLRFDFERCAPDDEARLSQLTLWVLECERAGLEFTIDMGATTLDSKRKSIDEILEHLARY